MSPRPRVASCIHCPYQGIHCAHRIVSPRGAKPVSWLPDIQVTLCQPLPFPWSPTVVLERPSLVTVAGAAPDFHRLPCAQRGSPIRLARFAVPLIEEHHRSVKRGNRKSSCLYPGETL